MAKVYWVAVYNSVKDADKLAAYAKLGGPAIEAAGGRFVARGNALQTYENATHPRGVVIEFDSLEAARAAHDSPGYQAALRALGDGADRSIRILEGV
jgi:uncharacterized protein (DUF1330 family)